MTSAPLFALAIVATACRAPAKPTSAQPPVERSVATPPPAQPPPSPTTYPVARFLAVVERGESLYGLGVGCDEWRAVKDPDGRQFFKAREPDVEGRIFSFGYSLPPEPQPQRITIAGRGSYSYAPGRAPEAKGGMVTAGVYRMCLAKLDLRAHPRDPDAVLVGDDVWYLTRAACERSRNAFAAAKTCKDHRPRS